MLKKAYQVFNASAILKQLYGADGDFSHLHRRKRPVTVSNEEQADSFWNQPADNRGGWMVKTRAVMGKIPVASTSC